MRGLISAISFMTILPIAPRYAVPGLASARAWFPVVGLMLGGILAATDLLLNMGYDFIAQDTSPIPPVLPAVILTVGIIALTRALHLDGLMDCCDALFGGFSRERRLEILRDPRVGAFAVAGAVSLLFLKVAAIMSLPQGDRIWILILFPCLSRWAATLAMEVFPYARDSGIGTPFFGSGRRWHIAMALIISSLAAFFLAGPIGLGLLAVASATAWSLGKWSSKQLGGLTGDVYGAIIEVTEVAVLLVSVFLVGSTLLPVMSPFTWLAN